MNEKVFWVVWGLTPLAFLMCARALAKSLPHHLADSRAKKVQRAVPTAVAAPLALVVPIAVAGALRPTRWWRKGAAA